MERERKRTLDWKKEISKLVIDFVAQEVPNVFSHTEYDCGKLDRKYVGM